MDKAITSMFILLDILAVLDLVVFFNHLERVGVLEVVLNFKYFISERTWIIGVTESLPWDLLYRILQGLVFMLIVFLIFM